MKYQDILDPDVVDAHIMRMVDLVKAVDKETSQNVLDCLWNGYDRVRDELIEYITAEWNAKKMEGE